MKIGILTQPLHNNYGGLLQNFALQWVLKDLGHEPVTINFKPSDINYFRKSASILKSIILKTFGTNRPIRVWATQNEKEIISQHTSRFVKDNINTTNFINRKVNEDLLKQYGFDAYVVGSDQVWRPRYSPQQPTFFLDFLDGNTSVKKITYAASFGVSEWEFNEKQTNEFGRLLKQFDAISVREDSAVDLCKRYFDVDAIHLLDPTMLLDKEAYILLANEQNVKKSPGNLFTYILDKSSEKNGIVDNISNKYNLKAFSVMPQRSFYEPGKRDINDCVFHPVEEWIRGFMDAKFVVTDSFHGTVFSILFNVPFLAIGNKDRGLTRFTSLLRMFELEDRLVTDLTAFDVDDFLKKEVDWEKVDKILEDEKSKAREFLINSI